MLEKREFDRNDFLWRVSTAVTVVSGFFSLIVFILLVINYLQFRAADPVNDPMITQMRQEYAALPKKDDALAVRIRALELINRRALFTTMEQIRVGSGLLLAGVVVFMISFKYSIRWQREKPELEEVPTADKEFLAFAQSRQMIMWTGVGILAVGMASAVMTQSLVASAGIGNAPGDEVATGDPSSPDTGPATPTAVAAFEPPKWDVMERNWPSFRGPGSLGMAYFKTAPTDWDVESGKGVRWKVETGLPGPNSPVIWDNRVFISGADETAREIYCYSADDGKLLWKQAVENIGPPGEEPPKVSEDTGFAAPTMVAHGGRVVAIFADGDLVSYDADGNKIWEISFGVPENHYGHSSSLLAYDKFLYVQLDQNKDPKLIALNIADGTEAWTAKRDTISWASPIIAQTPMGDQLILNSSETIYGYDPLTGKALWSQADILSGEVAPSPAYGNSVVFAAQEYATSAGIQLEKSDDGIVPTVLWEFDEQLPEISSPVGDGERFYFGTAAGILICLDAKSGEKLWEHEFDNPFLSSPVVVGDRLYVADDKGDIHIIQASSTFNLIGTRAMGEPVFATPAYMDGRAYIRTEKHLYCIEQANA